MANNFLNLQKKLVAWHRNKFPVYFVQYTYQFFQYFRDYRRKISITKTSNTQFKIWPNLAKKCQICSQCKCFGVFYVLEILAFFIKLYWLFNLTGWLYKFGGRPKSWKRLWFILSNNCLYYFKFTTDKTPLGIIPLENILVQVPPEKPTSKQKAFVLYKDSPDPSIVDLIKTCKTLPGGQTVPRLYK